MKAYSPVYLGIPVVDELKFPKLKSVLEKIPVFQTIPAKRVEHPLDDKSMTKVGFIVVVLSTPSRMEFTLFQGYCLLQYGSKEKADNARMLLDGLNFGKDHTFCAYPFTALKNIQVPDEDWEEPQKEEYIDVVGILHSW